MRALTYHISRLLAKLLFAPFVNIHLLRPHLAARPGAWILASNHISHFDPPLLGIAAQRKVDWMAMAELFSQPLFAAWLRGIDTFPVDRAHLDRQAVRIALTRLRAGHAIGMFPEGGIRDGAGSILKGAPLRPGVAGLSQLAGAPIVPCVIIGTDRIYGFPRFWRPGRRIPVWIAFGDPLLPRADLPRPAARGELESTLAQTFQELYKEARQHFQLTEEDLPQPPSRRLAIAP